MAGIDVTLLGYDRSAQMKLAPVATIPNTKLNPEGFGESATEVVNQLKQFAPPAPIP